MQPAGLAVTFTEKLFYLTKQDKNETLKLVLEIAPWCQTKLEKDCVKLIYVRKQR